MQQGLYSEEEARKEVVRSSRKDTSHLKDHIGKGGKAIDPICIDEDEDEKKDVRRSRNRARNRSRNRAVRCRMNTQDLVHLWKGDKGKGTICIDEEEDDDEVPHATLSDDEHWERDTMKQVWDHRNLPSATDHPPVRIEGIDVFFPKSLTPYEVQVSYMATILRALRMGRGTHATLESPTGTGKTMALLSAASAWLVQARLAGDMKTKIVFTSRTHSQIQQAMEEFRKKSPYLKTLETTLLASRDHLCIHEGVRESKNRDRDCKKMGVRCKFRLASKKTDAPWQPFACQTIEELPTKGRQCGACPYIMTRQKGITEADIIFCSYNYPLEPRMGGKIFEACLEDYIIIFDEGHNMPEVCRTASDKELRQDDMLIAITAIDKAIEYQQVKDVEAWAADVHEKALRWKGVLMSAWSALKNATPNQELNQVKAAEEVYAFLTRCGFYASEAAAFLRCLEAVKETIADVEGSDAPLVLGLEKMVDFFRFCYAAKEPFPLESFRFLLREETEEDRARSLSLWCFDAEVRLRKLHTSCRNIIITSGTLCPMPEFVEELGIPVPLSCQFTGAHVATKVQAFVCSEVRLGEKMIGTFTDRDKPAYKESLLDAVVNAARAIPGGLLVFFPSSSFMRACVDHWKSINRDRYMDLQNLKKIFMEPKTAAEYNKVAADYAKEIESGGRGACFFAYSRGKASEGMDFKDAKGRCVIQVGIPFAPRYDIRIEEQKQHFEKKQKGRGLKWYTIEAIRAVNQAIGRVLRHIADYGAIILLDGRFCEANLFASLSSWLKPHLSKRGHLGALWRDLQPQLIAFFRSEGGAAVIHNTLKRERDHDREFST